MKPSRNLLAALAAAFLLLPGAGNSQEKASAQQERMKTCNAQAGSQALKGDKRQEFMRACLKGESASAGAGSPQARMKTCNVQASRKELNGEERKAFMSRCLKG
jgi:hypothetical protein